MGSHVRKALCQLEESAPEDERAAAARAAAPGGREAGRCANTCTSASGDARARSPAHASCDLAAPREEPRVTINALLPTKPTPPREQCRNCSSDFFFVCCNSVVFKCGLHLTSPTPCIFFAKIAFLIVVDNFLLLLTIYHKEALALFTRQVHINPLCETP